MLLQMHFWNASSANPTDVLSHCVAGSEIPPPRLHIEFTFASRIHPQKNHIYPLKPLYSKQIRQASYLGDSQLQQIKEHSLLINMDRKLLKSNLL